MKKVITKENAVALTWVIALSAMILVIPEMAYAQNLNKILNDGTFKSIITFGLGIYAAWKWFSYFADFNPGSAFTQIIVPAVITFLAFKWLEVLKWFAINTV